MSVSYEWKVRPQIAAHGGALWVGAGCNSRQSGIMFGTCCEVTHPGKLPVWLSTAKEQVIAITGKRGSGKSYTLGVLAEGLSLVPNAGSSALVAGDPQRGAVFFDPLDLYWTLAHDVRDSTVIDLSEQFKAARSLGYVGHRCNCRAWVPGKLQPDRLDPTTYRMLQIGVSQMEADDWRLLLGGVSQLDPLGQALAECLDVAAERHGLNYDIGVLIGVVNTSRIEALFQRETLRALRQRLAVLDRTGLFASVGTSMSDLVRPGEVSVILLNRLSQENRELVVGVVSRMLFAQRQESAALEKRLAFDSSLSAEVRAAMDSKIRKYPPKAVLILDEAQGFLSPSSARSTRNIFTQIVKEGRNCGLSVAMATQQPAAIDRDILSQVEVFVSHQLTTESDIRSVIDNFKGAAPEEVQFAGTRQDMATVIRSLPPGYCVVSASDMSDSPKRTFIVHVRPRFTVHGGIEV